MRTAYTIWQIRIVGFRWNGWRSRFSPKINSPRKATCKDEPRDLSAMRCPTSSILLSRWSFGVLLYEVFSFGATPYDKLPNEDLRQYLIDGNRLEQPKPTPENMWETIWSSIRINREDRCKTSAISRYKLMLSCWDENPTSRPSFTDLYDAFDAMLNEQLEQYDYMRMMDIWELFFLALYIFYFQIFVYVNACISMYRNISICMCIPLKHSICVKPNLFSQFRFFIDLVCTEN
jgi:serine/threonine protein kinase